MLCINIYCIVFVAMQASYKKAARDGLHIIDYTLIRGIVACVVSALLCMSARINPWKEFPWAKKHYLLLRGLSGHGFYTMMALAVMMAPISVVTVLQNTSPFWISIVAYFLLREPIYRHEIIGTVVCFASVLLMGIYAMCHELTKETEYAVGSVLALISAVLFGFSAVSIRAMKDTPALVIVFYHALFGVIISAVVIGAEYAADGADGFRLSKYSNQQMFVTFVTALLDAATLILSNFAYSLSKSGFIALMSYISVVYASWADFYIFKEEFEQMELYAALLILATTVATAVYKLRTA